MLREPRYSLRCTSTRDFRKKNLLTLFFLFTVVLSVTQVLGGLHNPVDSFAMSNRNGTLKDTKHGVTIDLEGTVVPLAIVAGFSANHHLEGISMLRSLIKVNYTGPLYVYAMIHESENEEAYNTSKQELERVLDESSLDAHVLRFDVEDAYDTYCFKPKLVKEFLHRSNSRTFMWADTSTRFKSNPEGWAKRMTDNNVDLSARTSIFGMGQNTHPDTFKYLNISVDEVKNYKEIASGHFMVNLERPTMVEQVLNRWIACAVDACRECMAPVGSSKKPKVGKPKSDVGSKVYVAHRQDQSVLGVLAYNLKRNWNGTVSLNEMNPDTGYMSVTTERKADVTKASQLLETLM